MSEGDVFSKDKAKELEDKKAKNSKDASTVSAAAKQYSVITVPRARRVHQSLLTTPLTAAWSLVKCIQHITIVPLLPTQNPRFCAEVLVLNGPGTCFTLCAAIYLNKVSRLPWYKS